jgi:hypothetical protein
LSVYGGHSDIIYSDAIDDRIKELQEHHDLPGTDTCTTCNEDEHNELEALMQFREDVISECGGEAAWIESPGFIADNYFGTYVQNDIEGMVGSDALSVIDRFLDWDAINDEYMGRFEEIDFDGVTYLVDNNRG